jgi:hypothetical protein
MTLNVVVKAVSWDIAYSALLRALKPRVLHIIISPEAVDETEVDIDRVMR